MGLYELSKALYQLNDPQLREAYLNDPEKYLQGVNGLSDKEKTLILNLSFRQLYEAGVSIYLSRTLGYVHGVGLIETGIATGGQEPRVVGGQKKGEANG